MVDSGDTVSGSALAGERAPCCLSCACASLADTGLLEEHPCPASPLPSPPSARTDGRSVLPVHEQEKYQLVLQLTNPETREGALLELSKRRESFGDLAPILWHSVGTMAALLQEIVSIYPLLSPPSLVRDLRSRRPDYSRVCCVR